MLRSARLLVRRQRQSASFLSQPSGRGFAEAATEDASKYLPPVPVHGTAGRYAAALYIAGAKAKKIDAIDKDLQQVWKAATDSEPFREFLKDPSIPKPDKQAALDGILGKMGVSDLTKNFFSVLAENNRLSEFAKISNTFDELVAAARGEVMATITTASELSQQDIDEIKKGLHSLLEKGQKLIVQEEVDPAIIGGIVIDIGDKHIDMSISSRIKKIQQMVLQNV